MAFSGAESYDEKQNSRRVSYPSTGYNACLAIEDDSFWFQHRNKVISYFIEQENPINFLDVGGGNGFQSMMVQNLGIDTIMVEPGINGAQNARNRGVKKIVNGTMSDLESLSVAFHSAGAFDVVEHIEDDIEFLGQMNRLMIPEAPLYLTVPAFNFLWSVDDVSAGHYRRYTKKKIKRSVEAAGFRLEYCSYFFSATFLPLLLLRAIPSLLGIRRQGELENKQASEHKSGGVLLSIVNAILAFEKKILSMGLSIPFGSSIIVVARKDD